MTSAKILIIGAGAMGVVVGDILQSSGAAITYLVRPARRETLSRPQVLYSYDDDTLHWFTGYQLITCPEEIERNAYDFVVFTIDGIALRSPDGQKLVRVVGGASRGTKTNVLIGTIGANLRPEFLRTSGLSGTQVFSGGLYIAVYQTDRVTLPVHPPTDPRLLAQADFAYRQHTPIGLFIDSSAPEAATRFAALFQASGRSQCLILSPQEYSTQVPAAFATFAACNIVGWKSWAELDADSELWQLTAAAAREIQGLSINGEAGTRAQAATTPQSVIATLRKMEEDSRPLDFLAFNRFHHGGKVFEQDVELLRDCVRLGEAEQLPMSSLRELIRLAEAAGPPGMARG